MERLTKREVIRLSNGEELVNCNHEEKDCNDSCMKIVRCKWYEKAMKRLKAYEDTKLTPEEVKCMQKDYEKLKDTVSMAETALEKQIPKAPIETDNEDVWYRCPVCKGDLTHIRGKYCAYCGQKLDWN